MRIDFDRAIANARRSVVKQAMPRRSLADAISRAAAANKAGSVVQLFDKAAVADKTHVTCAYINALVAFKNRANRAKSIAMEMLLFASLTDQIGNAVKRAGAKEGSEIVVFASSAGAFSMVSGALTSTRELDTGAAHARMVLGKLGIKTAGGVDGAIMQAMALSQLDR